MTQVRLCEERNLQIPNLDSVSSYRQIHSRGRGVPGRSLFGKRQNSGSEELLQVSLTHTVDLQVGLGSDARPAALSLGSFFVLGVPHASFGVVVVEEVPQA